MEFEVRAMAGMESCYASLPLSLIQTLDSSARASLPQILTLQLRPCSAADRRVWHLAWSGSSSSSSAIEVAQQFAECIGLPDRTIVQVRALPNVPKASIVTIEPLTEDDWEVIELNAENAEAAILQQVRIVHEKMRFPLWLHGGNAVTFIVVSTVPNNSVVQLVPGTEVAVAPKRRRKSVEHNKDSSMQSLDEIHYFPKVLLRVEDPKKRLTHKRHLGSADVCIELTSIALIHPETAKRFSFDSLQVVVLVPKLSSKVKSEKGNDSLMKGFSSPKKLRDDMLPGEKDSCYAIVHLLFSESVANGHLMLSQSLRQHLGASQHSWVYMQRYVHDPKKNISSFSLSPCQFLTTVNKDTQSAGLKVLNHGFTPKSMQNRMGPLDWSANDEFVSALYLGSSHKMEKEAAIPPKTNERVKTILHAWVMAQVHAISSMAGVEATSLVFGPKTFLHFEMVANDTRCNGKQQDSTTDNSQDARMVAGTINEMSFLLTACGDSLCGGTFSAYQLAFQTGNEGNNNSDGLRQLLEKLSLGDSISFDATDNGVFNHRFASTLSSLSWMGEAASDVFNSRVDIVVVSCFWDVVQ